MVKTKHFSAFLSSASADHAQNSDFNKYLTAFNCYNIQEHPVLKLYLEGRLPFYFWFRPISPTHRCYYKPPPPTIRRRKVHIWKLHKKELESPSVGKICLKINNNKKKSKNLLFEGVPPLQKTVNHFGFSLLPMKI